MTKITKRTSTKQPAVKPSGKPEKIETRSKTGSQPMSKHDQILSLLRRKQGASLDEMQTASGWQPHSVRGFLSGTVKRRLGLKLQSSQTKDGERRYAVVG